MIRYMWQYKQLRNIITTSVKGPAAAYRNLISTGKLSQDSHQERTVTILENLFKELQTYERMNIPSLSTEKKRSLEAAKVDAERHKSSPDFAWIQDQPTILERVVKANEIMKALKPKSCEKFLRQYGPKGLYIYGSVGTGKSMIMDLFYKTVPIEAKKRIHFHAFMQDVHRRIHVFRSNGYTSDVISLVASELSHDSWLLCFDELQVTDIADAMIIRQLFDEMFNRGVVMVATSNRHPDELYTNGIQRKSFLPTIEVLKERMKIHSLDNGTDYRRLNQEQAGVFFDSKASGTNETLERIFQSLSKGLPVVPKSLRLWGRKLTFRRTAGRVLLTDFGALCLAPLSAADYLEIATEFGTIILKDIPKMGTAQRNEARRFITMIDTFYDAKVKLIASLETGIEDLLAGDELAKGFESADRLLFDELKLSQKQVRSTNELQSTLFTGEEEKYAFKRAVSRLVEMQSLAVSNVNVVGRKRNCSSDTKINLLRVDI